MDNNTAKILTPASASASASTGPHSQSSFVEKSFKSLSLNPPPHRPPMRTTIDKNGHVIYLPESLFRRPDFITRVRTELDDDNDPERPNDHITLYLLKRKRDRELERERERERAAAAQVPSTSST